MTTHKVIIITGASSGIGRAAALRAARRGFRVVAAARRSDRLEQLVAEIERGGGEALAVTCDVTSPDDQQRLIGAALDRFGRIDVLVNNAGVPLPDGFVDESLGDLRRQWQTNVLSLIELTKRALQPLRDSQGIVINIGSVAGHFSLPGWGMYYSTKVAVASISDVLRRELRPYGVRVCLVEPGPFETEFAQKAGMSSFGGQSPEQVAAAIVRLCERPRRLTVVPGWLGPLVALGGGLVWLLPGLVDLASWAIVNRKLRDSAATTNGTARADTKEI